MGFVQEFPDVPDWLVRLVLERVRFIGYGSVQENHP